MVLLVYDFALHVELEIFAFDGLEMAFCSSSDFRFFDGLNVASHRQLVHRHLANDQFQFSERYGLQFFYPSDQLPSQPHS